MNRATRFRFLWALLLYIFTFTLSDCTKNEPAGPESQRPKKISGGPNRSSSETFHYIETVAQFDTLYTSFTTGDTVMFAAASTFDFSDKHYQFSNMTLYFDGETGGATPVISRAS